MIQVLLKIQAKTDCYHIYLFDNFPSMFEVIQEKDQSSEVEWEINSIGNTRLGIYFLELFTFLAFLAPASHFHKNLILFLYHFI